MGAFILGVVSASMGSAAPPYSSLWIILLFCMAGIFLASLRRCCFFAMGAGWFYIWMQQSPIRSCIDPFWFICSRDLADEPAVRLILRSWMGWWIEPVRFWLDQHCRAWHPVWGLWAFGLIGGKIAPELEELTALYRQLGLLHVLVISGSHFIYLSRIFRFVIGLPARVLYTFRLLSFTHWFACDLTAQCLNAFLLGFYALVVGFPPPCQRAFILIVLQTGAPLFTGLWARPRLMLAAAFWQALLFPLSFTSLSNILSWSTAAVLVQFSRPNWLWFLPREMAMGIISLTYFGVLSPIGLLLNPLLEHVWGPLLLLAAGGMVATSSQREWINYTLDIFHEFLRAAQALQIELWDVPSLTWNKAHLFGWNGLAWLLSLIWIVRLSSRPEKKPTPSQRP